MDKLAVLTIFFYNIVKYNIPLLYGTVGEITVEKSGSLNLGVEGIMAVGAIVGYIFGCYANSLLVGISDYGPSDDPETFFYAYDGASIREVGYLTDILGQNVFGYDSAICHGDGTVTARKRWDVLGTWSSVGLYEVNGDGIKDITDFYPYIDWDGNFTTWEVTSKVNLLMYDPGRPDDGAVTVPAGTVLAMTGLRRGEGENLYWVTFDVESMGKTLGMSVERIDWYTCVCTDGGFVTSEEAFDGFFYAG